MEYSWKIYFISNKQQTNFQDFFTLESTTVGTGAVGGAEAFSDNFFFCIK